MTDLFFKNNNINDIIPKGKTVRTLPKEITDIVGKNSIDLITSEISYIYYNNFNYDPRPVFQTYQVTNAYLDNLNYEKYMSRSAPDYILYSSSCIDDRYPFWDESLTKLAILKNYTIQGYYNIPYPTEPYLANMILFKKNPNSKHLTIMESKSFSINTGETLKLKKTENLLYLYADIKYSFLGQLRRILFQPNLISVYIKYENDPTIYNFRAIVPLINNGVLINKKIFYTNDALVFYNTIGKENINTESICFLPKSIWIKDKINIIIKKFFVE